MPSDLIGQVEAWAKANQASRSEALRQLVELGLRAGKEAAEYQAKANESATKARKLASELGLKAKSK